MGVAVNKSGLWLLVSDSTLFRDSIINLQTYIYIAGVSGGCVCFLTAFMAFVSVCYKFKTCYLPVRKIQIIKFVNIARTIIFFDFGPIHICRGIDI